MPWKFILFIAICLLFSIFIGFNLPYTGTIDFLFAKVENAPIFLVVLFSFLAGACVGLLASVFKKSKKRKKEKLKGAQGQEVLPESSPEEQSSVPEKRRGRKRK